jgi:hypothetical protein
MERYDTRRRNKNGTLMTANDRKRLESNRWSTVQGTETIQAKDFKSLYEFKEYCKTNGLTPQFRNF